MPLHNLPIRSKLALMFVTVCLVTFGVGGYLASGSATKVLGHEVEMRLEYQSRAYATALDGYLRMLTRRCEDFASDGFIRDHVEALISGAADRERLEDELRTHLLTNKLPLVSAFLDLTLIGSDGEVLLAARSAPPAGFAARLAVEHADEGPWCSALLEGGAYGDYPRLAIATPLRSRDRAQRLGDLVAWVHPSVWIVDALRSGAFQESDEQRHVALQLVDQGGHVLDVPHELTAASGPLPDSELVRSGFGLRLVNEGRPSGLGPAGATPVAGRDVYSKSFPIAANGWSVRVALPGENILSAASDLQSRILGIGILLSIAASLLFLFPMRFLTRPLLDLAAAARKLATGDLSARVEILTDDEIGDLGKSFNTMAEAIQERAGRLERTTEDLRTRKFELGFERDRLQAVIASMRDGLVVLDADGVPVIHNAAAGPLLKQVKSGHSSISAYHRCEDAESTHTECRECLFSPIVGPRSCVVEIDGGVFEIHAARLAPDADGRSGRVLVSRDLTDRVAQDERHIHQERLAVLGEVA
ncbi:MAG: HAMP domain-containing protein, partial [Planctomycetota bacterium]